MFYGLTHPDQAPQIAQAVCRVLGTGNNGTAVDMLIETAAAETLLGHHRDPTERYAGAGLTQVDEPTFDWLKEKFIGTKDERKLKEVFGFTLGKVTYAELELSPLLAFVFCRLRYRVVEAEIPDNRTGRAQYWKDHYNSRSGAGTPMEFMERCEQCVTE